MSGFNRNKAPTNPWHKNRPPRKLPSSQHNLTNRSANSTEKFKEAQKQYQEAAQKFVKEYDSSEEEEDLETNNIIGSILQKYGQSGIDNASNFTKTQSFLEDSFLSASTVCLVCLSSVKRSEPIWSCSMCYCSFHLMCIQRWSKDTIAQQKLALEGVIVARPTLDITWCCPKCRQKYDTSDIPSKYECFCKKTTDPVFQPFLVPHSCGETCDKDLKPACGHKCILLCHPGACPPCPTTVIVSCLCGSQLPRVQRCSNREWSCGSPCNKLLPCNKHKCTQPCHAGDCPPCPKKSIQNCICGANKKLRDCMTPIWQCDNMCDKPLDCGFHNCSEKCHVGECDTCELSKVRFCSCRKSTYILPCTEETPTCGDTCAKTLDCGIHICYQRCHKDRCGTCAETITKSCRCGQHTKEVQCKKPYLCETKCKKIKDCNKHPCNRKCCDGNCPPCEKPCGRTLSCSNHKCSSICHRGPCYPCALTETVSCRCGKTIITVPCGRKHKTRPPKCNEPCLIPPDCHHEKRDLHRCHFGDCPPCRKACNKSLARCEHICPAPCHSAVLVKVEGQKPSMPWEQTEPQVELKALACPECKVLVPVTCLGKHETSNWPCHIAKETMCGRQCGRLLICSNHRCSFECHSVTAASNEITAGTNCETCTSSCAKPRPEGCTHICPKPCHPGSCPPCKQMLRIKCYCGLSQPYVECSIWTSTANTEALQSCSNQCPLNYACGHRCRSNCHAGPCPNAILCKKKVKIACKCKRLKKEFPCDVVRLNLPKVDCDEVCLQKQQEEQHLKELEDGQKKKEEDLRNLRELEKYEKRLQGKKKTKERRVYNKSEERSLLRKYWLFLVSLPLLLVAVYYMFIL